MLSKKTSATLKEHCCSFWENDSGATAIEYGLIASGIFMAIIIAINSIGSVVSNTFNNVSNGF